MQIDWITVAAQIVNFLVLVWLLNRVLYRPLSRALEERARAVRHELTEAEAAQARAAEAEAAHLAALRAFEEGRTARLSAVEAEAEALRERLTRQAHDEIAGRRDSWSRQLADEKAAFLDRLRRRAGAAFVTLARNALAEMSDRELLEQIARVFARRLATLAPEERAQLAEAARANQRIEILSSESLSAATRTIVAEAVERLTGTAGPEFRVDPALESGILLVAGSRHVGWTLGEHLDAFESDIAGLLSDQAQREGATEVQREGTA